MTTAKVASYLPLGLGPLVIRVNGTKVTKRLNLNFQMTGATTVDSAESDQLTIALPAGGASSWDPDVEAWLTTPSSALLLAALDDKTGTGLAVFGTAPTVKTSLSIRNPGDTASYVVTPGAISANRVVNLPVLGADDTLVCVDATQTLTGKTINVSDNPLTATGQAAADLLVNDGTRFVRLAKGTALQVLRVNAGETALEWAAASGGFTPPTGTGLVTVTGGALDAASTPLGAGVPTWLSTPSSANLLAAITDETGTGALVFGTAPTFKTTLTLRNPADTFSYIFTPSAIAATRTVTIPLLTGNDTLVTQAHAQPLSNKTTIHTAGLEFDQTTEAGAGPFNNYALGNASVLYCTGNPTFTGFAAPSSGKSRLLIIITPVGGNVTLNDEDAGSTAANRIELDGSGPAVAGANYALLYVQTLQRWKLFAYPQF